MFIIESLTLIVVVCLAYSIFLIRNQLSSLTDYVKALEHVLTADERVGASDEREEDVEDMLSEEELARLERDQSFDKRIRQIKDELAKSHTHVHRGTIAEESHPSVKNLPHNIIPTNQDLPDVEYIKE